MRKDIGTDLVCLFTFKLFDYTVFAIKFCNMQIDRIEDDVCFTVFYEKYLMGNKPCILGKRFTETWPVFERWGRKEAGCREPDWDNLCSFYGDCHVPVANCEKTYYDSQEKMTMTFSDYVKYLVKYKQDGYPSTSTCLYLKDWHFTKDFLQEEVYKPPVYFQSDWLNDYFLREKDDDYRFVYIGPKGSWTPFHRDVFGSFSWSANIFGRKKWILLPHGEEETLKRLNDGHLPYDLDSFVKTGEYPSENFISVIQNAGEVIFVPSGWYHQVWNLDDTVSINHNWFNASNIGHIRRELDKAREDVTAELSSYNDTFAVDEWTSQIEIVLRCHHGMNTEDLTMMLKNMIQRYESKQSPDIHIECPSCSDNPVGHLCNPETFALFNINKLTEALMKV